MSTTDYSGMFVYKDDHLDHILTSEGRLKWNDNDRVFYAEYFITDHLGNVRSIVSSDTNQHLGSNATDYYPFGMEIPVYGNSDNQIKYNSKELQTEADLEWYDYGARYYDPVLGRFHSIDRFTEDFSSWSPYHYANNNPILHIDVMGDSAWAINNSWNEDYIAQYQASIQKTIQQYKKDGKEFTCEDLALSVMMDFAESNGLPVTITNGSGTFDARSDDYTDGATFKNDVLTTTGAPDLQNDQNTTTINVNQATSGDFILNRNEEGQAHHTQVVYSPTNDIGVMGIKQGNSGAMNKVPGASRIFGAGNPNSLAYTGKHIESAIYVPAANFYKNYTTGSTISNYSTTKNIVFKRFNFSNF